jgi:hypothetical protein
MFFSLTPKIARMRRSCLANVRRTEMNIRTNAPWLRALTNSWERLMLPVRVSSKVSTEKWMVFALCNFFVVLEIATFKS